MIRCACLKHCGFLLKLWRHFEIFIWLKAL